jgi:hypothetical protein
MDALDWRYGLRRQRDESAAHSRRGCCELRHGESKRRAGDGY